MFVRHARARRYVIRVRDDGSVRVTVPRWGSKREAQAFAQRERTWIEKQQRRIAEERHRRAVCAPPSSDDRAMRARAKRELPARLLELAAQHRLVVSRVSVRDQKWRWGSCSRTGHICLNWRLIQMPDFARDYVIIHELMHLKRMDHSPRFWKLVAAACPDYEAVRRWLRAYSRSTVSEAAARSAKPQHGQRSRSTVSEVVARSAKPQHGQRSRSTVSEVVYDLPVTQSAVADLVTLKSDVAGSCRRVICMRDVHKAMESASESGFGTRLRKERERRRITLTSIAANTKINLSLLQGLESGDVTRWPSGIFRRSFIRSYASAIGLDADDTAREFLERYPDPNEPAPAPASAGQSSGSEPHSVSTLRLRLVDSSSTFLRGPILAGVWRRWAAAGWDIAAVLAMGAILFLGLGEFWMSIAIATLAYYASSIVILGNTPGVSFFASGKAHRDPDDHSEKPSRGRMRLFTRSVGL